MFHVVCGGTNFFSSISSSMAISIFGGDSFTSVKIIALRFFDVTCLALGHRPLVLSSHMSHLGLTGTHITYSSRFIDLRDINGVKGPLLTCPKPTNIWLMSPYSSFGSQDCRLSL